jgi:hypothetical protein
LKSVERALRLDVRAWPYMAARGWRLYAALLANVGRNAESAKAAAQSKTFDQTLERDVTREWGPLEPPTVPSQRPAPRKKTRRGTA